MVLTPMVGLVQAGKGQESLSFKFYNEGAGVIPEAEKRWFAGNSENRRNVPWEVSGAFYIEIGPSGAVETIPKECLSMVTSINIQIHNAHGSKTRFICNAVIEIITINTDASQTSERGTIEIRGYNNPTCKAQSFVGFGTSEFEGVKNKGTSTFARISSDPVVVAISRIGAVMGWPTPQVHREIKKQKNKT